MSGASLTLRNLRKAFTDARGVREILSGFSLELAPGSLTVLLGPSGVGKTTLLRIAAGLDKEFKGDVCVRDLSVTGPSKRVELVFSDYRLMPWHSVWDNIAFGASRTRDPDTRERIKALIDSFGLADVHSAWPSDLSAGQAARVALARALVEAEEEVLLLDEPFKSLDMLSREDIERRLRLWIGEKAVTTLMVGHDITDAAYIADRLILLQGPPLRIKKEAPINSPLPRKRPDPEVQSIARDFEDAMRQPDLTV